MHKAGLLYQLQTIELEIADKSRELDEVKSLLGRRDKVDEYRARLEEFKAKVDSHRATLKDLELSLKGISEKLEKARSRL